MGRDDWSIVLISKNIEETFIEDKLLCGYNLDIYMQLNILKKIIMKNDLLAEAIDRAPMTGLNNYYIGAGCITQSVWNYLSGYDLDFGIKDIDFVYFDDSSLDIAAENAVIERVKDIYKDLNIDIDIKNQARVHLWYDKHFGYSIKPYTSVEAAINTWPTTATAIGVRKELNGELKVYAPFGLNDLLGKIVRPNKVQVTEEIYNSKVSRWLKNWPDLNIIPWESEIVDR